LREEGQAGKFLFSGEVLQEEQENMHGWDGVSHMSFQGASPLICCSFSGVRNTHFQPQKILLGLCFLEI
jgi:hypothetical protein